jgi:outer membrane protein OmpA-like peptidoglycan-associated protein
MVVSETGAQASCAKKPGQAGIRNSVLLVAAAGLLTGCSSNPTSGPIDWWHRQQGGKIAEERPAPPGADQPYPNMSTVPAKPTPPNQEELKKLTDSLVADRTNAQHAAQAAPLADPSSPTASPNLFGVGTAPPPPPPGVNPPPGATPPAGATPSAGAASAGAPVASASMPAVTTPAAPPSPAPRKAVQSTPLEAPPAQTAPGPAAAAPTATAPAVTAPATTGPTTPGQTATAPATPPAPTTNAGTPPAAPAAGSEASAPSAGPPPTLPAAAPPRPALAGPAPVASVVPAPMPVPAGGTAATIVFVERSTTLSQPASDEVKAFAAKRGKAAISVIGYGDAASSEPEAQSAALNLGLSRAQSIVEALKSDGVPGNAIRVSAEASGRGASLQLLQ